MLTNTQRSLGSEPQAARKTAVRGTPAASLARAAQAYAPDCFGRPRRFPTAALPPSVAPRRAREASDGLCLLPSVARGGQSAARHVRRDRRAGNAERAGRREPGPEDPKRPVLELCLAVGAAHAAVSDEKRAAAHALAMRRHGALPSSGRPVTSSMPVALTAIRPRCACALAAGWARRTG